MPYYPAPFFANITQNLHDNQKISDHDAVFSIARAKTKTVLTAFYLSAQARNQTI